MRENTASKTSMLVAMLRAIADAGVTSVKGFKDPTAKHFISGWWLSRYESVKTASSLRRYVAMQGADNLALRTVAIDEALVEALARGATQLVILGAGLDGRAYRMTELANVHVFEVDHPATQGYKRDRSASLVATAKEVTFVPVNFEHDSLDAALEASGHNKGEPTVWISEGVIVYLTDAGLRSTLKVISERSAKGSTFVAQYHTADEKNVAVAVLFTLWGEPPLGLRSAETMQNELTQAGLEVVRDTGQLDWAHTHHADEPKRTLGARLAVAVKPRTP